MRITKPSWILHVDESRPTKPWLTLYAIDVHPDGSRVATGGLDTVVRIWNTAPALEKEKEEEGEEKCPRLLCTGTSHAGAVTTCKWSNGGAYLASGADDGAVLVWALDGAKGGKVWGSETTNIENWKATRRLVGHQSDVANVAWSPDDRFLASVGLDNQVFVWSGNSFELLRKLQGHRGFVKGVVFDPVGQFLATQSDDNSMKIWRTTDWGLEKSIEDAFDDAPKSNGTRPAWSPDGSFIVAPNAMNGPVFVAGVIARKNVAAGSDWGLASSLIGHPDIVTVAAYNPLLFLRDPNLPPALGNTTTLVAIAARSSISLWLSDLGRPLAALEEVFDRDVLDLSWSKDGLNLWACSSDGQVAVITFSASEFPPLVPESSRRDILSAHGFTPRLLTSTPQNLSAQNSFVEGTGTAAQPNKLVARKTKRPRTVQLQPQAQILNNGIVPAPTQSTSAAAFASAPIFDASAFASTSNSAAFNAYNGAAPYPPPQQATSSNTLQPRKRKASALPTQIDESSVISAVGPWVPSNEFQPGYGAPRLSDRDYRLVGHTLTGGNEEERPEPVVLAPSYCLRDREPTFKVSNQVTDGEIARKGSERVLGVKEVVSFGSLKVEDSDTGDTFEWRNFDRGGRKGQAEVRVVTTKKTLWVDYLPNWVVLAAGSPIFTAVGCEDGSLIAWSPTGRRLIPTLVLDSPLSFLVAEGSYLLAITALGSLSVWDLSPSIPRPRSLFPPLNISTLLSSSASAKRPSPSITTSALLPNGTPLIALDSGSTFSYDKDLQSWTRVCEPWWSKSDAWEGRRGRNANASSAMGRGIVRSIEGAVNEIIVNEGEDEDMEEGEKKRLEGEEATPQASMKEFNLAITLSHLETRIKAAASLDSPAEYKTSLLAYTRELAKEGLLSKATELIRELLGPIYHKLGRKIEEEWTPFVLGLSKRDLLRDVLRELAKDRVTKPLADEYQKILKEISSA